MKSLPWRMMRLIVARGYPRAKSAAASASSRPNMTSYLAAQSGRRMFCLNRVASFPPTERRRRRSCRSVMCTCRVECDGQPASSEVTPFASRWPRTLRRRNGGIAAIGRNVIKVARLALDDATPAIDGNLAAFFEHVADLVSATLHPRFQAGKRDTEHVGGFLLSEAFELPRIILYLSSFDLSRSAAKVACTLVLLTAPGASSRSSFRTALFAMRVTACC